MNQLRVLGDYQYHLNNCIGEGAFGKVFRGIHTKTGLTVAVKKIDQDMINQQQYLRDALEAEIQILKSLDHQNIVRFIEKFHTDRSIYIVTELCDGGDLKDLMKNAIIPEIEVFKMFCQIIDGMEYLVKKNIIHRDLKPANILNHNGTIKIADFGFAKYIDNTNHGLLRTCVGSPLYMSPQIQQKKPYSSKSDIWSLGVMYYEMLFKKAPWNGFDINSLRRNVENSPLLFPQGIKISEDSRTFITRALQKNEADRIDWVDVFRFFADVKKKYTIQTPYSFKSVKQTSQIISKQKQKDASFKDQMKLKNGIRLQMSFSYFVIVEMIQNLVLVNHVYPKGFSFEMLCLLYAKLVCLKYQNYYEEIAIYFMEQGQANNYKSYIDILQNEFELADELLRNTIKNFEMTGKLKTLKQQQEDYQYIEKQGLDIIEDLENKVKIKINALAKGISKIEEKFIKMPYEVLSLLDYILDTQITSNQIKNNEEINYREIHDKEKFRTDLNKFAQEVLIKIDRTFW